METRDDMSSRRARSPGPNRGGSARGSARGSGRGSWRQQAQTSDDEDDGRPVRQMGVRRSVKRVLDRMGHANLINAVEILSSSELNHVESSLALKKVLDVALEVGNQYEEIVVELKEQLVERDNRIAELEKDADDRTILLEDDRDRVFAPSVRMREEGDGSGRGASARGSARGAMPQVLRSLTIPPPVQAVPAPPVASMPQPNVLPYPSVSQLPERGGGKQCTALVVHYLASVVPLDAVVQWCRAEQNLLKEWIVGMDEGRGEVLMGLKYSSRKMVSGSYTFRIDDNLPTLASIPPPKQQEDALRYVRRLPDSLTWKNDDDISEGEAR